MKKYSLCIIDDTIPAVAGNIDNSARLNAENLRHLVDKTDKSDWAEPEVRDLIDNSLKESKFWNISAFTNPNIYMNCIEEELYIPDIIIYDWDYPGIKNPDECLLEILEASFSIINIFTHVDKDLEVTDLIENDEKFRPYKKRIAILHKGDANSVKKLIDLINKIKEDNFSFKFGSELRYKTIDSVEKILIELGKYTPHDVVWILGEEDKPDNKRKLLVNHLVDFIVHKLRNELVTYRFGSDLPVVPSNPPRNPGHDTIKNLWSFRLYYKPSDDLVRKGDIIKKNNYDDSTLYLVISSDCHLCRFWSSNMGFLALVPLHKIDHSNENLKTKLKLYKSTGHYKNNVKVTSLTNTTNLDGPTIIPVLQNINGQYFDYILCPKEIFSEEIPNSKIINFDQIKNFLPLSYEHIEKYSGTDRIGISEPFLTPLIQHILLNVTGYGVPDYPDEFKNIIKENIKGMFS